MKVICGPYEQRGIGVGELCWCPPENAIGAIDLRSLANHNVPGIGLFALDDGVRVPRDFTDLGQWGEQLSGAAIQHLQFHTGLRGLAQGTLDTVLWQMLVGAADPTGQSACKPIMPERHRLRVHFAGMTLGGVRFNPTVHLATLEQFREGYRLIRQETLDGKYPTDHHRRVLDYWGERLGIAAPQDVLIPSDLPKETRLPHATTLTESFNKSDGAGWGPDQAWGSVLGSTETLSNEGWGGASSGAFCQYVTSALSSADIYAQFAHQLVTNDSGDHIGPTCRHPNSSANTHYYAMFFNTNNGRSFKFVAGTLTNIGTNTSTGTLVDGQIARLECNGSSILRIYNGTTQNTATDTAIDGVTVGSPRAGIRGVRVDATTHYGADNWEAGDLAAAAGNPHYYYHQQAAAA